MRTVAGPVALISIMGLSVYCFAGGLATYDQVSRSRDTKPDSPSVNGVGYDQSCNGKFSDELLDGAVFHTQQKGRVLVKRCRKVYNRVYPQSSLRY